MQATIGCMACGLSVSTAETDIMFQLMRGLLSVLKRENLRTCEVTMHRPSPISASAHVHPMCLPSLSEKPENGAPYRMR